MKDTGSILTLYGTILSGLTYNGTSVPVYLDEPVLTTPENYVHITNSTTSPAERNNTKYISEVTVTIDIVTRQYKESNRTIRDSIANSILTTLLSKGFSTNTEDFQATSFELQSSTYLHEIDGPYHINRKILTISNLLIQL